MANMAMCCCYAISDLCEILLLFKFQINTSKQWCRWRDVGQFQQINNNNNNNVTIFIITIISDWLNTEMIKCLSPSVHHHHQYNRKCLNIADISVKSMRDLSIWSNLVHTKQALNGLTLKSSCCLLIGWC